MAAYTPPLRDFAFVLHDVLEGRGERHPRLRRARPRLHRRGARGGRQDRGGGAGAPERGRRPRGLPARERGGAHPRGLPRRLRRRGRRRLDRHRPRPRLRRPGHAARAQHRRRRDARRRQHGAEHVLGPEPRRLQRHPRPRLRGAEGHLPAAARLRRLVRHDEPDRAALRHRPRAARAPAPSRSPTAAIASPGRRSSSPPASTTSPRTSCTWCWRASPAPRRA